MPTNMVVHPVLKHVIVDGSNIATEGRELPSLAQLDEAVQSFIREYEPEIVTVVVDATFPNRIARSERQVFEDAINAGEVITPPAGAIGRGDAFVLQIADRAGATVLSNDSFQEFHGTYDWLFDEGRLIGGKPVPHVGWVFMPRTPVRGPTSRRAVSAARRAEGVPAPAVSPSASSSGATPAASGRAAAPTSKRRTTAGERQAKKQSGSAREGQSAKATVTERAAAGEAASAPEQSALKPVVSARIADRRDAGQAGDQVGDSAAPSPPAPAGVTSSPETSVAYNDALPFIEFVSEHPVGSGVDAVVEHFGSHGAYLRIGNVRAYVPLKNLADPAPRSAKEVVRTGESRRFVVAAIDPPRRGIDLAIPGVVPVTSPPAAATAPRTTATGEMEGKPAGRARQGRETQLPAAGDAKPSAVPTMRAGAKRAAEKAPARQKAAARPAAAKKAATKKAVAKKAADKAAGTDASTADAATRAPSRRGASRRAAAPKTGEARAAGSKGSAGDGAANKTVTAKKAAAKPAASKKAAAKKGDAAVKRARR